MKYLLVIPAIAIEIAFISLTIVIFWLAIETWINAECYTDSNMLKALALLLFTLGLASVVMTFWYPIILIGRLYA